MAIEPNITESYMRQWVRNQNDSSELPVNGVNFSIDGDKFTFAGSTNVSDYRIETPLFQINIPDSQGGSSLREFENPPIVAGYHNAVVDGYFLLITGFDPDEKYTICESLRGSPGPMGEDYTAGSILEVEVRNCSATNQSIILNDTSRIPELMRKELDNKVKDGVITEEEKEKLLTKIRPQLSRQEKMGTELLDINSIIRDYKPGLIGEIKQYFQNIQESRMKRASKIKK